MILSKSKNCGTCKLNRQTNNLETIYSNLSISHPDLYQVINKTTGETRACIDRKILESYEKGPITIAIIVAIVIVGCFGAGLATGIMFSGKKDIKEITTIITNTLTNTLTETLNENFNQEDNIKMAASNSIEIRSRGGCQVNFKDSRQEIRQIAARIVTFDANVRTQFDTKLFTEFSNKIQAQMGSVTDPITILAKALGSNTVAICTQIKNEFTNTITRIRNLNYRQISHFSLIGKNQLIIDCGPGDVINYINNSEDVIQEISSQAYMKIISEAISESKIVSKSYNDVKATYWEFSTGFIIAIVAILLILVAIFIYLKTTGVF